MLIITIITNNNDDDDNNDDNNDDNDDDDDNNNVEGRKDMFCLTTQSTHFIYGYMASDIWCKGPF